MKGEDSKLYNSFQYTLHFAIVFIYIFTHICPYLRLKIMVIHPALLFSLINCHVVELSKWYSQSSKMEPLENTRLTQETT